MYTFVVNFVFLSVTFVGISKLEEITIRCSNPRSFFQVIIFHCILLLYNWEAFQNSFLFGSIFDGRKIINVLSLLFKLSNLQCILISYLLFLIPIYLPCSSTDHSVSGKCQNV